MSDLERPNIEDVKMQVTDMPRDETKRCGAMRGILVAGFAAVLGLTGCAPAPAVTRTGEPIRMPAPFFDLMVDQGIASQIASECGRYRFNFGLQRSSIMRMVPAIEAAGLTERDLELYARNIPRDDRQIMQNRIIAYIEERNILIGDEESFCAAGDVEVAAQSQIAEFLIAR